MQAEGQAPKRKSPIAAATSACDRALQAPPVASAARDVPASSAAAAAMAADAAAAQASYDAPPARGAATAAAATSAAEPALHVAHLGSNDSRAAALGQQPDGAGRLAEGHAACAVLVQPGRETRIVFLLMVRSALCLPASTGAML